jgi:SNF2 family DNA or RNA helicase
VRQRVGRVNRIGQKSRCINVVNLITKNSIEEKILAGLQLKTDLFAEVFDGGADTVQNFKSPPRFDSSPYTQFHDHHLFKVQTRE